MNYIIQENETRISFYNLRLQDVPFGGFKINAEFGYTSFQISSLPSFGSFYPSRFTSLKGGNITFGSRKASFLFFGGQLYGSPGLDKNKSTIYGIKGIFTLAKDWTFGAGYIKGNNLPGSSSSQKPVDCDIFTLDSSVRIYKKLYFLGDFKYALFSGDKKSNDYSIKIGPYLRGNRLAFQFYYNYITPDFPQIERVNLKDRQGYTFIGEIRPFTILTLYGSVDTYNENLESILERPITDYLTLSYGANLSLQALPNISFRISTSERDSEKGGITITDSSYDSVFLNLFKQYKRYSLSLRYISGNYRNFLDFTQNFQYSNYAVELRKIFLNGSLFYLNGYFTGQKNKTGVSRKENYNIQSGATVRLSQNLQINSQFNYSYGREKPTGYKSHTSGLEAGIIYNFRPWNLSLSVRYRYSKSRDILVVTTQRDSHQVLISITKSLTWGKRSVYQPIRKFSDLFRGSGNIEGYVFIDLNQNDILDNGEEALSDIDILLDGRLAATTDEKGFYRISPVILGTHKIYLHLRKVPAFYEPISGQELELEVTGKKTYSINFRLGLVGFISGNLFLDLNENGKADENEPPREEIKVNLLQEGKIIHSAFTDTDGFFKFDNLISGEYTIEVDSDSLPEECRKAEKSSVLVKLKPGQELRETILLICKNIKPTIKKVFSLYEGSISGRIVLDANRNGKIDPDEKGISGTLLQLKPVNEELQIDIMKTYSDRLGSYRFDYIIPGIYVLSVNNNSLPEGTKFILPSSKKVNVYAGQELKNQDFLVYF